jgi:hypothetical protein
MDSKDFEAARTAGTNLSPTGNTYESTQPAFGSATGAGVASYPHKENPQAATKIPRQEVGSDQHNRHTGRDTALGAGALGRAAAVHHERSKEESEEPKEKKNILKKIFGSGDKQHDEAASSKSDATHHIPEKKEPNVMSKILHPSGDKHNYSTHEIIAAHTAGHSRAVPTNEPATNASLGSAHAAAPIGAAAVGSAFAGHEMKKPDDHSHGDQAHQHATATSTVSSAERYANPTVVGHSTVPATGPTSYTHQPLEASSASGPLGAGAVAAAIGVHEHKKHEQSTHIQQNPESLTHHQHNTGSILTHNESAGHRHKHDHHTHHGVVGASHDQDNFLSHSAHEQRDLHQHGGNDSLSHHVHNGVTAMPHHNNSKAGAFGQDANAGDHRIAAGPALGAGAATAGTAAASLGQDHNSKRDGDLSHPLASQSSLQKSAPAAGLSQTTSSDSGPASKTRGPHKSNILNILDPRIKPDMQALKEDKEAKKEKKEAQKENESGIGNQSSVHSGATGTQMALAADHPKTTFPATTGTGPQQQVDRNTTPLSDAKAAETINEARSGNLDPRVAVAGAGNQSLTGTSGAHRFTETAGNTIETSGAAGTHSEPAHTDNVKGIVTGERGIPGDPSNVYSRKPLDERVTMPGTYPDSSTNVNKTT